MGLTVKCHTELRLLNNPPVQSSTTGAGYVLRLVASGYEASNASETTGALEIGISTGPG